MSSAEASLSARKGRNGKDVTPIDEMLAYYARRAPEYDGVYDLPQWQRDLTQLKAHAITFFEGCRVFEVACGTGYWTRYIAQSAAHVYATDVNEAPLAIARARDYPRANVIFERRDAFTPSTRDPEFDGGFAGVWLSHVDLARMETFLQAFHSYQSTGAQVMMCDERETEGRRRHFPASRLDGAGNRYERRRLQNGEQFEIIKNFYGEQFLRRVFAAYATELVYEELRHFWVLTYRVKRCPRGQGLTALTLVEDGAL